MKTVLGLKGIIYNQLSVSVGSVSVGSPSVDTEGCHLLEGT